MIWILLIQTAPAVCETHPGGDLPHAQGLGLFPAHSAVAPRPAPSRDTGPGFRHFHVVLFGVEFYLPGDAGGPSPLSPDGRGGDGWLTSDLSGGPWADDTAPKPTADTPALAVVPAAVPLTIPDAATADLPYRLSLVCDRALGRRSGTLRI